MPQKIEKQQLQIRFMEAMGNVPFTFLDVMNPFRIQYFGKEYYIYIKNLSSAYFQNPDVWRAQLPILDIFREIKESDTDFIFLGYDADNDVYTTWNPVWVKQRLNNAESVSCYSRLSLQKEAAESHELKRAELNNDGEVIAFPREMISLVLMNVNNFFQQTGDYVAMGSKKRPEANDAYKILTDTKNIPAFANYLSNEGKSQITIGIYCRSIKTLLNDGHIQRNRKIFLVYDSIEQYSQAVDVFMDIPEIREINERSHSQYSAALKSYIEYLAQTQVKSSEEETQSLLPLGDSVNTNSGNQSTSVDSDKSLLDVFCSADTIHQFELALSKKNYLHSTVKRYVRAIRYLVQEGYITRHKDLFEGLSSFMDYSAAASSFFGIPEIAEMNDARHHDYSAAVKQYVEFLSRGTTYVIHHTEKAPVLEDSSNEYLESTSTDWEAPFIDGNGKLTKIANPELLDKIRPYLDTEYPELAVAFSEVQDFYGDRFNSMELHEWGALFKAINWAHSYSTLSELATFEEPVAKKKIILRVSYPDGKSIEYKNVADTYVEVISDSYPDRIAELNIEHAGVNIVSETLDSKYQKYQRPIKDGWYIMTNSSTETKMKDLQIISDELELGLTVEMISVETGAVIETSKMVDGYSQSSNREKIRITFPDGRIFQPQRVLDALIEVVKFADAEKVRELNLICCGDNLILKNPKPRYQKPCKPCGNGWLVNTYSNTRTKFEQITEISRRLNLGVKAEIV